MEFCRHARKELNHDGHLIGTCHMAARVERYQMEIDALAGTASCMSLLNVLNIELLSHTSSQNKEKI